MSEIVRTYRRNGDLWADVSLSRREVAVHGGYARALVDIPIAPIYQNRIVPEEDYGLAAILSGPLRPIYDHSDMD